MLQNIHTFIVLWNNRWIEWRVCGRDWYKKYSFFEVVAACRRLWQQKVVQRRCVLRCHVVATVTVASDLSKATATRRAACQATACDM